MIFEVKKKIKGNFIYFHRTGPEEAKRGWIAASQRPLAAPFAS
jgi:hypothetical protein